MIFTKIYKYIEENIGKYKNNEKFKNFVKATFVIGIALYRQFNKILL